MRKAMLFTAAALFSAAAASANITYDARCVMLNLPAGGHVNIPFTLNQGEVIGFMTTPISNPANFSGPDTIAEMRSPADALITSNDDAGTDGIGAGTVGPVRGSMLRYRPLDGGNYNVRVRGFSAADAGVFTATYVRFTPGVPADFEDNDTADDVPGGANDVGITGDGQAKLGFGTLTLNDIDYYVINVTAGDVISAFTIPLGNLNTNFAAPDTLLSVRNPDGSILFQNDDAGADAIGLSSVGPTRGSTIRYQATVTGQVLLAVAGFSGSDVGNYALAVSVCNIPTPGAFGLMGLAGITALRRRR
ncbi:MAG: hypothetical protein JNK35_10970 [Phycisphaerae bacterium]|nr:hypothetical protein [Phycisphaerae bacterium]